MSLIRSLIGILIISLASCTTNISTPSIPASPVEPEWIKFSRPPVIEKVESNFIVSDQFVEKAYQEHEFIKRFRKWKAENSIP